MTNVELRGVINAHNKNRRAQKELDHHQRNELSSPVWISQDKSGKCYTYRGVEYCYN